MALALVLDPGVTRGCVESKCLEPGVGATGLVGLAALKLLPLLVLVLVLALAEGSELPSFVRFFLRNEPKEGIRLEVVCGRGGRDWSKRNWIRRKKYRETRPQTGRGQRGQLG